MEPPSPEVIDQAGLQRLIDVLWDDGWTVLGPTVRDSVIGNGEVRTLDDLPRGLGDTQDPAHYRLRDRGDEALFGYVVGQQSWKSVLFPARELLRRSTPGAREVDSPEPPSARLALFGVRSCDLAAIGIHDRVLLERRAVDTRYAARREATFVVAVTCGTPGGTCFCTSMGTGPDPSQGFDLALTELLEDGDHRFLVRAGSQRGVDLLARIASSPADRADVQAAAAVVDHAVAHMGRALDTDGIRDLLYANAEHPQWDDVARRCLSCTNCTLVCPTCFCTSAEDHTELATGTDERWRVWDSCFTSEYSYLHGGSVRPSVRSRYRQWATHKLASWHDQFGSSGCVGCGRCVTWCPAAIDLTAEVAAIRASASPPGAHPSSPPEA